jgi:hypothetical protein
MARVIENICHRWGTDKIEPPRRQVAKKKENEKKKRKKVLSTPFFLASLCLGG